MACGIYKTITVDRLQLEMSRAEVESIFGRPEKVLIVGMTEQGRQEILAYKIGNDIYTLEFMNDQLVRYEFLREDMVYVPHPLPPPPTQPIVIVQPVRPQPVERPPTTRPSPPAAPVVDSGKTEQTSERQGRRSDSGRTNQERTNERDRPATSETNRTRRENVDTGQSNRNSRSSERSVQNRQTEDL